MDINADSLKEKKGQSGANASSRKQNSRESADNRSEGIENPRVRQLRLYEEMANNNPQAKQIVQLQAIMMGGAAQRMPVKAEPAMGLTPQQKAQDSRNGMAVHLSPEPVAQRMAVPLDSVQSLSERGVLTPENAESARVIGEAFANRVRATGERVAGPQQVAGEGREGGLARIGLTEELRIFGHGAATAMSGGAAVQVGGYTPEQLASLLVRMGLPENYQGEIYLSGCLTAVGPGYGFLGEFYNLISAAIPGVKVRGNLGNATTFPDGTQGVWTGDVSKEMFDFQMKVYKDESARLLAVNERAKADFQAGAINLETYREIVKDSGEKMLEVQSQRDAFLRTVYDTTGGYTVTLPGADVQASNAIHAIVSGAVTSAEDVQALLDRIDEDNLGAALETINRELELGQPRTEDLVRRTETLDTGWSFKFRK